METGLLRSKKLEKNHFKFDRKKHSDFKVVCNTYKKNIFNAWKKNFMLKNK